MSGGAIMEENLKALYTQEIDQFRLDFDHNPEYQAYYTQAEAIWKGGDMPPRRISPLGNRQFPLLRPRLSPGRAAGRLGADRVVPRPARRF